MTTNDTRVPGVTLHFESVKESPSSQFLAAARVVMTASIADFKLWDRTKEKLTEGIRLYDAENVGSQMLKLLQGDNGRLETELKDSQAAAHDSTQRLLQRVSYAEDKLEEALAKLHKQEDDMVELARFRADEAELLTLLEP